MNGGAACNNSTPRPHLGHFPSAVWQGTTTERTAVLCCGGISGSCAVDISPPLVAVSHLPLGPVSSLCPAPRNRLSPSPSSSLSPREATPTRTRIVHPASLFHSTRCTFSVPSLPYSLAPTTPLPLFLSPSLRHIHAPGQPPLSERARAERAKSSDISAAHIALDGTQYVRRERQ